MSVYILNNKAKYLFSILKTYDEKKIKTLTFTYYKHH